MLARNQAAQAPQGVRVARRGEVLPPRLLREPPAGGRLTVAYDAAGTPASPSTRRLPGLLAGSMMRASTNWPDTSSPLTAC